MENQLQGNSASQMSSEQNDTVRMAIKNLVDIAHTGHEGYNTAADNVKNPEYAALFRGFAQQRQTFEHELKQCVARLGGDPEAKSAGGMLESAAGALHRGWINIKSAITGGGESAILDECERGDEIAIQAYQSALEQPFPQDVAQMLRQQYQSIQEAYTRVKGLARVEA